MIGDSRYPRIRKLDGNTVAVRKLQAQAIREAGVVVPTGAPGVSGSPSGGGGSTVLGTTPTAGISGTAYSTEGFGSTASVVTEVTIKGDSGVYLKDDPTNTQLIIRYQPINSPSLMFLSF